MNALSSPLIRLALLVTAGAGLNHAAAQGTAFTYQGQLQNNGIPASGSYDLSFSLFRGASGGTPLGGPVTNSAVAVRNGLFTVTVDLGSAVWDGATNWLEIGVQTNGGTAFATLSPRQQFTPAPYAITAEGVISGGITSGMLASGVVTADKIAAGAVNGANIDDGGSGAYQAFQQAEAGLGADTTVAFASLTPVAALKGAANPAFSFAVNGTALGRVIGFSGYEAISQPYKYVVELVAPTALNPDAELGQAGQLSYSRNGQVTTFGGLVTACSLAGSPGSNYLYSIRLESPLAYLALKSDYHIFQNQTVPAVISNVYQNVTGNGLAASLGAGYSIHTYLVQYRETSFNFVSRLMEQEGIFYFFNHSTGASGLVLGDNTAAYLALPNSAFSYYGDNATNAPAGEYIRSFHQASQQSTLTSTVDSYNFATPAASLVASARGAEGLEENYEFGNDVQTLPYDQQVAQIRQDRQTVQRMLISGAATAPDLRPGYTFSLNDQSGAGLGGSYLVTSIHHAGFIRLTNGVSTLFYANEFQAIPATVLFRPAVVTPTPQAQPESAIVTGPAGEETYVDKYGRVKVQFHWDRYGTKDQNSSCWIRVATPMAGGAGRGVIFPPRIGEEVLVSFLEGDPDRPIIVGSLFNGSSLPPYALPANSALSTIRSTGTPGQPGQINEITFNDKANAEVLSLQAAKDLALTASNNIAIFGSGNLNAASGGTMGFNAGGNLSLQSSANLSLQASALNLQGQTLINGALSLTGGLNLDQANQNGGSVPANALTFGAGSGEGIASQRTVSASGNQYDLALYTAFNPRLTILNGGNVGVGTGTPSAPFQVQTGRTGDFNAPVALVVNTNTTSPSPALRVLDLGGAPLHGALSVSVNSVGGGLLAEFGNANAFVVNIANNGTISATGFNTTSDRKAKQDFATVDPAGILEKVASLPLSTWCFKTAAGVKHLGPVAQDFHAAFGLNGADDQHISLVDEGGVALAAIQGLNHKFGEKEAIIRAQAADLKNQAAEIAELKTRVELLEQIVLREKAR